MDICDLASDVTERGLEFILHSKRQEQLNKPSESAYECDDCGIDIPEQRRRAVVGCIRCVECQSAYEKS